jgi:hypothetical protein
MDGTRKRRVNGPGRTRWYARYRQARLADHMGMPACPRGNVADYAMRRLRGAGPAARA